MPEKKQNTYASAEGKLKAELAGAKGSAYAKAIIAYLLKRCEEDPSMAEDVMQTDKNWDGCFGYIKEHARTKAVNGCACISEETVFEWAEDYYRMAPSGKVSPEDSKKANLAASAAGSTAKQEEPLPKSSETAEDAVDGRTEQATEQTAGQGPDEVTDRATDEVTDEVTDRVTEKVSEKATAGAARRAPAEPDKMEKQKKPKKPKKEAEPDGQMDIFAFLEL